MKPQMKGNPEEPAMNNMRLTDHCQEDRGRTKTLQSKLLINGRMIVQQCLGAALAIVLSASGATAQTTVYASGGTNSGITSPFGSVWVGNAETSLTNPGRLWVSDNQGGI